MKQLIGIALIIGGVLLGLYVGGWIFFVGGIVDVIAQVQAPEISAVSIAVGIAKIVFAGFIGSIIGTVGVLGGIFLMDS